MNLSSFKKNSNRNVGWLIGLLIFTLPFERLPSFHMIGITVRLPLLVGLICIFFGLSRVIENKKTHKLLNYEKLLLLFVTWQGLLIPASINPLRAIEVTIFTTFVLLLFICIRVLWRKEYWHTVRKTLLISATLVTIFGLFQYVANLMNVSSVYTGLSSRYTWQVFGFPRIQSTALEPLYFAAYLLLPLSVMLIELISMSIQQWKQSLVMYSALILVAINLLLTSSRGGLLAGAVLILSIYVSSYIRKSIKLKSAILTIIGVLIAAILALSLIAIAQKPRSKTDIDSNVGSAQVYFQHIADTGTGSGGDERANARKYAWLWSTDSVTTFIVGHGPGQFGPYLQNNTPDSNGGWAIVNNLTLEIIFEEGIIGLTLILAGLILLSSKAIKAGFNSDNRLDERLIVIGLVCYLIATAVQFQTYSTLYIIQVWVSIGVLSALTTSLTANEK